MLLDLSHDGLKLAHVPIIYQLFQVDIYSKASIKASLSRQPDKIDGLSHHTVVTPGVHAISMFLFPQCFKVVKPYHQALSKVYSYTSNIGETHDASPVIKWIGSPSLSSVYGAVKIESTIYKVSVYFDSFSVIFTLVYIARRSCNCAPWRRY